MSSTKPIFIVDAMFGNIAKKLRLLGFDSFYSSNIEDDELLRIAKSQNRIVVTKDVLLANKAKKQEIKTVSITTRNEIEQFLEINEEIKLGKCIVSGNTSRCPMCNGRLEHTEKNDVSGIVPTGVLEIMKDFWRCIICEKIYWEGTHIKNLQQFTMKLNEKL